MTACATSARPTPRATSRCRVPHVTCDFKVANGNAARPVNGVAVAGDKALRRSPRRRRRRRHRPATLALTLGTPASFGPFTPGIAKTYESSTTANVISTAGDALLSVADPSAHRHRSPGQRHVLPAAGAAGPCAQRRQHRHRVQQRRLLRLAAEPADLQRPGLQRPVALQFSQLINANDALRTGAYSKTLTFTLSTTTP